MDVSQNIIWYNALVIGCLQLIFSRILWEILAAYRSFIRQAGQAYNSDLVIVMFRYIRCTIEETNEYVCYTG